MEEEHLLYVMTSANENVNFEIIIMKIIVTLRQLEDSVELENLDVTCKWKDGVKSKEACGIECAKDNGASDEETNMQLDPNNEIAGVPDEIDPTKVRVYSKPENLNKIVSLPKLTILKMV